MNSLEELKSSLAQQLFGRSKEACHREGICIQCGEEALPKCYSRAGQNEYLISGLCELCFDEMFGG